GRGLGCWEAPRALLGRLLGRPPDEFANTREKAACSGAGGLLPSTSPRTADAITDARIAEHRAHGGGTLVTGCGSSLARFRARGENATDLVGWLARGLPARGRAGRLSS